MFDAMIQIFTYFGPIFILIEIGAVIIPFKVTKPRIFAIGMIILMAMSFGYAIVVSEVTNYSGFWFVLPAVLIGRIGSRLAEAMSTADGRKALAPFLRRLQRGLIGGVSQHIGPQTLLFLVLATVWVPLVGHEMGQRRASHISSYLVLSQSPTWVLIYRYNSQAVLAEYDPASKMITGKFRIVSMGSGEADNFMLKEIGPLSPK